MDGLMQVDEAQFLAYGIGDEIWGHEYQECISLRMTEGVSTVLRQRDTRLRIHQCQESRPIQECCHQSGYQWAVGRTLASSEWLPTLLLSQQVKFLSGDRKESSFR